MNCPYCGSKLSPNASFCNACGSMLNNMNNGFGGGFGGQNDPLGNQNNPFTLPFNNAFNNAPNTRGKPNKTRSGGNNSTLILILALVALVAAVAVLLFVLFSGGGSDRYEEPNYGRLEDNYAMGGVEEYNPYDTQTDTNTAGAYTNDDAVDSGDGHLVNAAHLDIFEEVMQIRENAGEGLYDILFSGKDGDAVTVLYRGDSLALIEQGLWQYYYKNGELIYSVTMESGEAEEFFFRSGALTCHSGTRGGAYFQELASDGSSSLAEWESRVKAQSDEARAPIEEALGRTLSNDRVDNVEASSALYQSDLGFTHSASRVIDGDLELAWSEGESGNGAGSWLRFELDDVCLFSGFEINAGYQKNELYYKNNRPAAVEVYVNGQYAGHYELDDYNGKQSVELDTLWAASEIRLEFPEVYRGNVESWNDMVISEISLR